MVLSPAGIKKDTYPNYDVFSMMYTENETLLMMSQWRSWLRTIRLSPRVSYLLCYMFVFFSLTFPKFRLFVYVYIAALKILYPSLKLVSE